MLAGADARAELATGLNRPDGDTATNISTALIPNSPINSSKGLSIHRISVVDKF